MVSLFRRGNVPDRWQICSRQLPPWEKIVLFCRHAEEDEAVENEIPKDLFAGALKLATSSKTGTTLKIETIGGEITANACDVSWMERPLPPGRRGGLK